MAIELTVNLTPFVFLYVHCTSCRTKGNIYILKERNSTYKRGEAKFVPWAVQISSSLFQLALMITLKGTHFTHFSCRNKSLGRDSHIV